MTSEVVLVEAEETFSKTQRIESAIAGRRLRSANKRVLRAMQVDAAFSDFTRLVVDTLLEVWHKLDEPNRSTELAAMSRFVNELDIYNPESVERCLYFSLTSPSVRNVSKTIALLMPSVKDIFTSAISNWAISAFSNSLIVTNNGGIFLTNQQRLAELISFRGDLAHGRAQLAKDDVAVEQAKRAVSDFKAIGVSLALLIERAGEQVSRHRQFTQQLPTDFEQQTNTYYNIHFPSVRTTRDSQNSDSGGDRTYRSHVTCYICGESGHIAPQCRNVTCFKCHHVGHFANKCPLSRRRRQQPQYLYYSR